MAFIETSSLLLALLTGADDARTVSTRELLEQGVALHDQGRYLEAIETYDRALELEPDNWLFHYEKALTWWSAGKPKRCLETIEPCLKTVPSEGIALAYTVAGSCTAALGKPDKALKLFSKGLARAPGSHQLYFNRGATFLQKGKLADAVVDAKRTIELRPDYTSAYNLLAAAWDQQGLLVPGIAVRLRFLTLESEGPRAQAAARRLVELLVAGVTPHDGGVTISMSPNDSTSEGDFKGANFMRALLAASRGIDDHEGETDFDFVLRVARSTLAHTKSLNDPESAFVRKWCLEPIWRAIDAELFDALFYRATSSVGIEGDQEWARANAPKLARLEQWLDGDSLREPS